MKLEEGDYLVGAVVVDESDLVLSVSEKGFGKRTAVSSYRITNRAGKGVINMKTTTKNGKVVSILNVKEDSDVLVITRDGKILRTESELIRKTGRAAQGVRLVNIEEGDAVAAACVILEAEDGPIGELQEDLPLQ